MIDIKARPYIRLRPWESRRLFLYVEGECVGCVKFGTASTEITTVDGRLTFSEDEPESGEIHEWIESMKGD